MAPGSIDKSLRCPTVDGKLDDECLYYWDRAVNRGNNNDSLYFTDQDRGTSGLSFALWNNDVRQFIINNAHYYIDEFHADGFRYDEISDLISMHCDSGWSFCCDLTNTLRFLKPRLRQNADFGPGEVANYPKSAPSIVTSVADGGMTPWLRYLIAFVVGCHGFIYIPFGLFVSGTLKEWRGSSRLLGSAVTGEGLKALVLALHVSAGIVMLACAVAIGFAASAPGWWRPLAIVGAALGIAGFAAFWDGQTQRLAEEGAIGAVISLILLVSAIAFPGAFG